MSCTQTKKLKKIKNKKIKKLQGGIFNIFLKINSQILTTWVNIFHKNLE